MQMGTASSNGRGRPDGDGRGVAQRSRSRCVLSAVVAAFVVLPGPIQAQILQGRLVSADDRQPVPGAMIVLLSGPQDEPLRRVLTDGAGLFRLGRVEEGTYRLRAERMGHASTLSESVSVRGDGVVTVELVAAVEPVLLEGLDVESDARCRLRRDQGQAVATVWEEVRKALDVARWTAEQGELQYDLRLHTRDLDQDAEAVLQEASRMQRVTRQAPFRSRPAAELIEHGFVIEDDGARYYQGPDADVLLSSDFLATHCFRLRRGGDEHAGLFGLSFQPISGRDLPEVVGTLWLDDRTAALRWLEWGYVNLERPIDAAPLGGRVEFERLPGGPIIVRDWWIRTPRLGRRGRRGRIEQVGVRQVGASVQRVLDLDGRVVLERAQPPG